MEQRRKKVKAVRSNLQDKHCGKRGVHAALAIVDSIIWMSVCICQNHINMY